MKDSEKIEQKKIAYQSVLNYCKGYESDGKEKGRDYKSLKKFVQEELRDLEDQDKVKKEKKD